MPRRARSRARRGDLTQRLVALAGLVVIVGVVVGVLFAAGLIGNQGGGKGIESAVLLETSQPAARSGLDVGPQVGKLAPDFEISDFTGTRHRLSDFRGKPVYVNFWATWCVPCQVELPDIQKLQVEHKDELAVISVNRREPLGRAMDFLRNLPLEDGGTGVSFSVNGMDPDDTLYDEYVRLLPPPMPVSVFIDADGVITRLYTGLIRLPTMEQAVTEALGATPAGGGG